jgi:hypothetical protein
MVPFDRLDQPPRSRGGGALARRILHTLAIGEVSSKRTAGESALHALDPEWAPLIRWALEDRPDPWTKVREPADPALLRRTRQFIDYAAGWAAEH